MVRTDGYYEIIYGGHRRTTYVLRGRDGAYMAVRTDYLRDDRGDWSYDPAAPAEKLFEVRTWPEATRRYALLIEAQPNARHSSEIEDPAPPTW